MTHAGSPRNLMQWKGSWSDSDFNMVEDDHFLLWGKVAQISTNHKPNGDKNSSSRIRFILWLIRVWNVIISDFHHQRFSRDTLCAWRKKSANDLQIILKFYSLRLCVLFFFFLEGLGGRDVQIPSFRFSRVQKECWPQMGWTTEKTEPHKYMKSNDQWKSSLEMLGYNQVWEICDKAERCEKVRESH